ncbi:uncharacterized protein LOC109836433 isoform X3 [Asparagus officinalis]|uniref:uncharacterized protein LOC109836433 isoform X3 n=1 Tax=Asparagus officinalis TaxID=4686 RepID=UPI00098E1BE6|nr:uncharacterized protein LOC109836433 isoform X3 [Asparagus officinalis]
MTQHWDVDAKFTDESTSSASSDPQPSFHPNLRPRNVFRLLALREISPRSKNSSKRFWNQTSKVRIDEYRPIYEIIDARHALLSWVEADSLGNLTAKYCSLLPPPRSTIAAAFSTDGKRLASTHGDHTVKIMDCQTGSCLKVLSGHRRTPWVVRFHPLHSEVLASGSLDHEVRLWNANTAACIGSHDFYRPIASIAFHAQGEVIAVASGHRLFMWHYNNRRGESASPTSVLKTRRSLRAVQFHPFGAPLLLTAEVNDLESPDHQLTLATTPGYPHYPPAIIYRNMKQSTNTYDETRLSFTPSPYISEPTFLRDSRQRLQQYDMPTGSVNWHQRAEFSQQQAYSNTGSHHHSLAMPMEVCFDPYGSYLPAENLPLLYGVDVATGYSGSGNTENINWQHTVRSQLSPSARVNERMDAAHNDEPSIYQGTATAAERSNGLHGRSVRSTTAINLSNFTGNREFSTPMMSVSHGNFHPYIPFNDVDSWQLPFLQGWVMGQTHAGLQAMLPVNSAFQGSIPSGSGSELAASDLPLRHSVGTASASSAMTTPSRRRDNGRNSCQHHSLSRLMFLTDPREAATEMPCTVKLRIWAHDIQVPTAPLDPEGCLLTIPHAVLCSEMGAHFSPCGRFLAACVACVLPQLEGDHGLQSQMNPDALGAATSPTQHPLSAHQVIYELRIYSLEEATFGSILASRAIRAAHCLTSIQFAPTSEHLLLAYGRRHGSLRWRNAINEETATGTYTIMELAMWLISCFRAESNSREQNSSFRFVEGEQFIMTCECD